MKTLTWLRKRVRQPTKAKRVSPPERVYELQNRLEDFRLMKKQSAMYFHWSMQAYDDADYYEMLEMMSARETKDRPVDQGKMWQQYNDQKKG